MFRKLSSTEWVVNPSTPDLSLDFARDGLRDGELAEPKVGACSGLILSGASLLYFQMWGLAPSNGSTVKDDTKNISFQQRMKYNNFN